MIITSIEKELALDLSKDIFNGPKGKLLFKLLFNYTINTSQSNMWNGSKFLDDSIINDEKKFTEYKDSLINYIIDIATQSLPVKEYSTGELSRVFGVTITSINNWINEGRFIGFEKKQKNKKVKIPENILWKSLSGESIPIKEIIKNYEENISK